MATVPAAPDAPARRGRRDRPHRFVSRRGADRYLLLTLVGFAGSVLVTRAYLWLTDYPQIGGGTLHIAHALWGGLLLFVASLLPLLVVNRSALTGAAVLSGVGVGLFIDEVGKFITADNDYFFPAAAPIAYAVFLLTAFMGLRVIRSLRRSGPRAQLHAALELLSDALDADLSAVERIELRQRLRAVASEPTAAADVRRLAGDLLRAVSSSDSTFSLYLAPPPPSAWERLRRRAGTVASRRLTERRLRLGLAAVLGVLGVLAVSDLTVIVAIAVDLSDGTTSEVTDVANRFARVHIGNTRGVVLLLARAVLDVAVGVGLLVAATLLVRGKRRVGAELAADSLLLALTVVNLLVFYLEQFLAAVGALVQLVALQAVRFYQNDHAEPDEAEALPGNGAALRAGDRPPPP